MLTYGGEDSPVLGGEIAEGFGVELHGWWLCRRLRRGHELCDIVVVCCNLSAVDLEPHVAKSSALAAPSELQRASTFNTLPSSVRSFREAQFCVNFGDISHRPLKASFISTIVLVLHLIQETTLPETLLAGGEHGQREWCPNCC